MTIICLFLWPLLAQGQSNCDDTYPPVVFVHGFLASGDTWTTQIQRFASNGHCQGRYFAFDWNSLAAAGADQLLDQFIDSVRLVTGSDQVHLVGHSAGGGRGYSYLSDPARAAKVISYAHIGSNPESGPAGPGGSTPTLNIWSEADQVVGGADIPGAENVQFAAFDHYQVATSAATFSALYEFFYGSAPATTSITPQSDITIGGRCITLGENKPTTGATIEVFAADPQGSPIGDPLSSFNVGADGFWGPLAVSAGISYLFKISSPASGFRKVIYYYEPFVRDNSTVYLRTFPPPFSLAGLLLSAIPNTDDQSVISILSSAQAVIHGRDQLSLNGYDLSTSSLADASASMIAVFCYDDGADGSGNAEPVGTFALVPFLQGADIPVPTTPEQTWTITFNGSTLPVRNWKSKSDGVVIAVFNEPNSISGTHDLPSERTTLSITPNPASGYTFLHLPGIILDPAKIILRDHLGRQVLANMTPAGEEQVLLNTTGLSGGTYTISVLTGIGWISSMLIIHP